MSKRSLRRQLRKKPKLSPLPKLERLPERAVERYLKSLKRRGQSVEHDVGVYRMGFCQIRVARTDDRGWHLFIGHPRRYPFWRELLHVRYELLPADVTMALTLGPLADGPPTPPNAFHLWEQRAWNPDKRQETDGLQCPHCGEMAYVIPNGYWTCPICGSH